MYERIYTVGCFDFFHSGHEILLNGMRKLGNQIIVGIHDDASIEHLKNLSPNQHEPIEVRIKNVRKFSDMVYVIPSRDPTLFLQCMVLDSDNKGTACFVRGDDMPNFPGRAFIENKISIQFLPYTSGISSTQIRKELDTL